MQFNIALLSALVATTQAILIIKPPPPVDLCKDWEVTWTHVDTDPTSFCLYLTNYKEYPPQEFYLLSVSRDSDHATIPGKCYPGLRSTPYRIWASKCGDPHTIYAESADFQATQAGCCPASTMT